MGNISMRQLAGLSSRLGTSLTAGLDIRRSWGNELARAKSGQRRIYEQVNQVIADGGSVRSALDTGGEYFPIMFRELVQIGEESGRLGETFSQLASHYETMLTIRRNFFASLIWPLLELAVAIFVIGGMILALGVVAEMTGSETDILGFGLIGISGFFTFVMGLAFVGTVLYATFAALRRGMGWNAPLQYLLLRIPILNRALVALAMGRLSWAMAMTFSTGMETRRAVRLSIETTRNAKYMDPLPRIDEQLAQGASIYESFLVASDIYPDSFLDALHTGEQSGQIAETMHHLSEQYQAQAKVAMHAVSIAGFFMITGLVATIIIAVIMKIAMFYIGTINSALDDLGPH